MANLSNKIASILHSLSTFLTPNFTFTSPSADMPKWRIGMDFANFATFLPLIFLLISQINGQIENGATPSGLEEDELYILLDDISVYSCRGVHNEINLTEEDVQIVNEKGNKVYYIKAPGNYSMHFKRINVLNPLAHLSGEIGVTLQVPIFEGPAGQFIPGRICTEFELKEFVLMCPIR